MARYMLHNVLIVVILCVAILFLSGIALPRLFSKQYFELRSELNSHIEDLKLNYKRNSNSTSEFEAFENSNFVESTTVWKNVSTKLQNRGLLPEVTSLNRAEKVKRKKRQAYSKSNDKSFVWNFNLNVTRYENNTPATSKESKHSLRNESNNYLGMAVYVEGNGSKRTYRELENAWSSVGAFIRRLFGNDAEILPPKLDNQENEAAISISGPSQTKSDLKATQSPSVEKFNNEGSADGSPNLNGREGRFIFEFLGFGGKSLDKTTKFSESEDITTTADPTFILDKNKIDNSFRNDANILDKVLEKSEMVTESNRKVGFQFESLALNTNHSLTDKLTDISKLNSSSILYKDNVPTTFESNEVTDMYGCFDCDIDYFEVSIRNKESKLENILDKTTVSNVVFTDEELEKYCMDLVNQLEESQRFLSAIGNSSDLKDENFKEGNQLSSVRGPEIFDLFSLFSALQQSQLNSNSGIVEDSFLAGESTISPSSYEPIPRENGQSRFFNLNMFGFGSGRSSLEATNDLTSDDLNSDEDEMENFPTIQDCESYFRKKQNIKMFPKPNLMDIISDPNIKLTDFTNGSISLKLKEQQLKFLTDRLKASLSNSSFEKSDINSANELKNRPSLETDILSERPLATNINPKIDKTVEGNATFVSQLNLSDNDLVGNAINTEIQDSNEIIKDGRIFSFLGFGSGNGGSVGTTSTERDGRFFVESFFGSGESLFESLDAINEPNVQILGNKDSLKEKAFFSGDSSIVDSGTEVLSDFTASNLQSMSGNGSGRQSDEGLELQTQATPFIEYECGSDCSFDIHNATDISHDCNDNECNINSYDDASEEIKQNCHDCLDYSFLNKSSISESVIDTPVNQSDENSTLILDYQNGNCSDCSHVEHKNTEKDSLAKVSFECDDCDIGTKLPYNFKNCSNCSGEIAVIDSPKLASGECGDCDFNAGIINYGNAETGTPTDTELTHETSHSHKNDESDCNDCNYERDRYNKELLNFKTDTHEILLTDKEYVNQNIQDLNTFTELQNTTESDLKTEKSRLFLSFLSGSGDGGLFRDSEGPIHLVEDTVGPRGQISRGGRLLDEMGDEDNVGGIPDISINQSDENAAKPYRLEDFKGNIKKSNIVKSGKIFTEETTFKKPVQVLKRKGRLDDEFSLDQSQLEIPVKDNPIVNNFNPVFRSTDHETMTENFRQNHAMNSTTELTRIASSSEVISNILEVSSTIFKTSDYEPRFCTSASECNIELNEGCVRISHSSVCSCRRQFVRVKETGECVAKSRIKALLKLPAEEFDEDLSNPLSSRFKDMRTKASDTMMLLLAETPELLPILAGLDVIGFSPGSLIVSLYLELAASNKSEGELVKYVESGLKKTLMDNLIEKTSLDVRNASVLSVASYLDPCMSNDTNYCSKSAYCFRNSAFPGGFSCRCKDDYFDVSTNKKFPGERCEALCPSDYCGDHGHCEYFESEGKRCLCHGWYFGDRCEIYGVVVIASSSASLFLIISVTFVAIVCRRRCRKNSYAAPPEFRRSEEVGVSAIRPRRVSDVIAMEENVGARIGKFQQISTPIQDLPVIKVTNSTLNEISLTFDYDSTFDRTSDEQDREI